MNKLIYLKTLAAIVACLALALPASAYSFVKDGIYYNVNGTSANVTYKDANYNSYSGTVIIPATVTNGGTTYTVRSIGPSAFQNCTNLRRVVLPNTIEYLMNNAFQNCTGLTNITLPSSIYTIYNNVFEGCTGLKSVICLNPNARPCFTNNFSTTTYSVAKLIVPQGSLNAYQAASDAWGQFNDIVEMSCDFVEDAIFYNILNDNMVEVTNVVRGAEAYSGNIVIPQTVTHSGTTYTVVAVGNEAFYYGHQLYTLELPSTVNSIGNYAFYECINLESVNIPEGVQYLNYCSFAHCRALSDITIPLSVTWIAQNCFYGCTTLSSIRCEATTPPMCVDSSCFPSTAYDEASLYVPAGSLNAYRSASVWQNFNSIVEQYYDFEVNGIYYIITGPNTASVTFKDTNYNSYSGSVTVPSTVVHQGKTYTVTAVGRGAFYRCGHLTSVSLPNTVTMLDYAAFANSSLTSLSIPQSVTTLGEFCFQNCSSLVSINLPNGITSIPRQCFTSCSSLQSITIPGSAKVIYYYAFYNCTALENLTIQNGVEGIMYAAFTSCAFQTVTIPASVTTIEEHAFDHCTSVSAFNVNSGNTHFCSVEGILFTAEMDTLKQYPPQKSLSYFQVPFGVKVIDGGAFSSCYQLEGITLVEGLESIGVSAFVDCNGLTEMTIPASVREIGFGAFTFCYNLRSINVKDVNRNYMSDDGVLYTKDGKIIVQYPCARPDKHYSILNTTDSISDYAFSENTYLKSLYLPSGIKSIPAQTFMNSHLERVVADEGLERIERYAFSGCSELKSVYLPSTLSYIGDLAFQVSTEIEQITFAGTTPPTLGTYPFYGVGYNVDECKVYVPSSALSNYQSYDWNSEEFNSTFTPITSVSSGCEFTVDSLKFTVTDNNLNVKVSGNTSEDLVDPGIPPKVAYQGQLCTVTMLQDHVFSYLSKMIRAEVPFTVELIDDYAFYDCRNLEKLIVRDGVKQISSFAFSHINKLTSINLPASVDSIESAAFTYDPALRSINVSGANSKYTSVDGIVFSKDKKRLEAFADGRGPTYTVPDGTQVIASAAFRGASALGSVSMPNSLKKIESSAFLDCTSLTEVQVPHGVTSIGVSAFNGCTALMFADLPATVTALGYNAFHNTPSLAHLNVRATTPPTCQTRYEPRTGTYYSTFDDDHYSNVQLVVPTGCTDAYKAAYTWKNFIHISETDFPIFSIRGDVNGDGEVNISDAIALINGILNDNFSNINMDAADTNEDGDVNISDAITLINYVLNETWPEPRPIDMWYLWGNFIGSSPWGDIYGNQLVGISALPLYPVGDFNSQGKGTLSWTGLVPRMRFTITHNLNSYEDIISEMWMVNNSTGQYCVRDMTDDDPNYSTFLLDQGYYTITLNTQTMTLTIEPYLSTTYYYESITMPGYYNDWDNTANAMDPVNEYTLGVENHDWWVDDFTTTNEGYTGELKFCLYDNWSTNWGSRDFPYGQGLQDGLNIPSQPGTYTVFFNDITGQYNFIKK